MLIICLFGSELCSPWRLKRSWYGWALLILSVLFQFFFRGKQKCFRKTLGGIVSVCWRGCWILVNLGISASGGCLFPVGDWTQVGTLPFGYRPTSRLCWHAFSSETVSRWKLLGHTRDSMHDSVFVSIRQCSWKSQAVCRLWSCDGLKYIALGNDPHQGEVNKIALSQT